MVTLKEIMLRAAWMMREIAYILSDLPLEVSTPDTAEDAPIQGVIRGNYYVDGSATDASDHFPLMMKMQPFTQRRQ